MSCNLFLVSPKAFLKAFLVAFTIPCLFINDTLTSPIPQAKQFSFIQTAAISLCFALNFFESLIFMPFSFARRHLAKLAGKTTAAATSGPANEPRPTSSAPATTSKPFFHNFSSKLKSGNFILALY